MIRFPVIAPRERWTRAQLIDYLYNCVLPEYGRRGERFDRLDWQDKIVDRFYAGIFIEALEWQPTDRLLGLCCSAAAPRKVNRRRWWDQLHLGLEIDAAAPLTRRQRWQLFRLLTQPQIGRISPASQAQARSSEAFASASL